MNSMHLKLNFKKMQTNSADLTRHVPGTFCVKEAGAKVIHAAFSPASRNSGYFDPMFCNFLFYMNEEQMEVLFFVPEGRES